MKTSESEQKECPSKFNPSKMAKLGPLAFVVSFAIPYITSISCGKVITLGNAEGNESHQLSSQQVLKALLIWQAIDMSSAQVHTSALNPK